MRPASLQLLAFSASDVDRARRRITTGAAATAGALLLTAARIARVDGDESSGVQEGPGGSFVLVEEWDFGAQGLSSHLSQEGLRPGVVLAALLLVVPVVALAVQALRLGSAARDRRSAALRFAGATPREASALAGVEAARSAALGGILAGPAYLGLALLLGPACPPGYRLLPGPELVDLAVWPVVVVLGAIGGFVAGAAVSRRVVVDPLGERRRAPRSPFVRLRLAVTAAALLAAVVLVWGVVGRSSAADSLAAAVVTGLILIALVVASFSAGAALVVAVARGLGRRRSAVALLAAGRLEADPRGPGRVAGVLMLCGLALGIEASQVVDLLASAESYDLEFYLTGYAMAAAGTLFALSVAAVTMVLGAVEHLVDARRPVAALAALGVEVSTLTRVLRLQLGSVALAAVVPGSLVGGLLGALAFSGADRRWGVLTLIPVTLLCALIVCGLALLMAQALRARIAASATVENLRAA